MMVAGKDKEKGAQKASTLAECWVAKLVENAAAQKVVGSAGWSAD